LCDVIPKVMPLVKSQSENRPVPRKTKPVMISLKRL